jgi:hypothetical protein
MTIPEFKDIPIPSNVKVHPYAWSDIKQILIEDRSKAIRIVQKIAALGTDPLPDNAECDSVFVESLAKFRVLVKRLKCKEIAPYRVFYAFRKKQNMVCVYGVFHRDVAYKEDSLHYIRIKLLYTQWREC